MSRKCDRKWTKFQIVKSARPSYSTRLCSSGMEITPVQKHHKVGVLLCQEKWKLLPHPTGDSQLMSRITKMSRKTHSKPSFCGIDLQIHASLVLVPKVESSRQSKTYLLFLYYCFHYQIGFVKKKCQEKLKYQEK